MQVWHKARNTNIFRLERLLVIYYNIYKYKKYKCMNKRNLQFLTKFVPRRESKNKNEKKGSKNSSNIYIDLH